MNFCTSGEILNIVFMSVAVLHSGDLALASEAAASTSPDLGNHGLSAVPRLLLMNMTFPPVLCIVNNFSFTASDIYHCNRDSQTDIYPS